jgi:hypothetical protein
MSNAANIMLRLKIEYLPTKVLNLVINMALKKLDMILSNVPGPSSNLIYASSNVTDILPVISTGRCKMFLPVFSNNQNFRFLVCYDDSVVLNPQELIKSMESNL